MNENEADRIAAAAHALRPDWPLASLRTLLARPEIATRARRDVAVALAWVACESATKTPARVLEAGPWWLATNAEGGRRSYDVPCPEHPSEVLPCGRCANATATNGVRLVHLTQARAELHAARSRCCSHGVDRTRCREDHPDPTDQPDAEEADRA
jgi:hypothetical protein